MLFRKNETWKQRKTLIKYLTLEHSIFFFKCSSREAEQMHVTLIYFHTKSSLLYPLATTIGLFTFTIYFSHTDNVFLQNWSYSRDHMRHSKTKAKSTARTGCWETRFSLVATCSLGSLLTQTPMSFLTSQSLWRCGVTAWAQIRPVYFIKRLYICSGL